MTSADMRSLLKEQVEASLESLPAREAQVLKLRFGLEGGQPKPLKAIGLMLDPPVTAQRVYQIEARALRRLRNQEVAS